MTLGEKIKKDLEDCGISHYMGLTITKGPFPDTLQIEEDELRPLMLVEIDPVKAWRSYCWNRMQDFTNLAVALNNEYRPEILDA